MDAAIHAHELSVAVRVPDVATWSLKEFVLHGLRRQITHHEIWPLRDVSVSIEPGELMGVIGRNGAGKTTLMKAISGIIAPTHGRVLVRGRVTPVLGLGAGLHPDLTGSENIELLGALLGRNPRDLRRRARAIAEGAELSDYLDVPLRVYSAGMAARLALAVVTDGQPDVLLLDEIFAVGDAEFQERSRRGFSTCSTAAVLWCWSPTTWRRSSSGRRARCGSMPAAWSRSATPPTWWRATPRR